MKTFSLFLFAFTLSVAAVAAESPLLSPVANAAVTVSVTAKVTVNASPVASTAPALTTPSAKAITQSATPSTTAVAKVQVAKAIAPLPASTTKADLAVDESFGRFALGVGYPDLRLRFSLGHGLAAETKAAFDSGIQVYTGRLSWNFYDLGPAKILVSTEGGFARIDNVDTISGNGTTVGATLGVEYPFAKRFRVSVDMGPMWLQASSVSSNFSTVDFIYNTALYLYLF